MNSPLPYDVMSIVYKQLSIEDKSNLIDALLIFQIWFSADLIKELRCKRGCVRCVPDGHTELLLLKPIEISNYGLAKCNICNICCDNEDDMIYKCGRDCEICLPAVMAYCKDCARKNDDFKMCEKHNGNLLYNKKCANHYDPLVTRCNNC
jgi:hypothetical protein